MEGFRDALENALTLPDGVTVQDFMNCPRCYLDEAGFALDLDELIKQLDRLVFEPIVDTQALFDRNPYLTRLFTTMSPADMTMDPVFTFNPELPDVSNLHRANMTITCGSNASSASMQARFSVALAQGGTVRGTGTGVWPIAPGSQPAAYRILQLGGSGPGAVLEDHGAAIDQLLKEQASSLPAVAADGEREEDSASDGCSVRNVRRSAMLPWLTLVALALALTSRRRRRQGGSR